MDKSKAKRGGHRVGSGRPPLAVPNETYKVRISPARKAFIEKMYGPLSAVLINLSDAAGFIEPPGGGSPE